MAEPRTQPSTAELIKRATEQLATLVREEMALARVELRAKARHAGAGAGLLGGAGIAALYGVAFGLAAIGLLLARVLPGWAAALVVGVALLGLAGLLALLGRGRVRRAAPPVPTAVVRDLRLDLDAVSTAVERHWPVPSPSPSRDGATRSATRDRAARSASHDGAARSATRDGAARPAARDGAPTSAGQAG